MVQNHLFHQSYNLFHLTNTKYENSRQTLLNKLKSHLDEDLVSKIHRILTTIPHLDTVNKYDSPIRLSRNFINTNVIESNNSQIRPFLDHLRNIKNMEYCATYFNLLRFKLNLTRSKAAMRNNSCPIEQYGFNLRNKSWVDILIDGLPCGSQNDINSSKIDLVRTCPQRVGLQNELIGRKKEIS